MLFLITQPAVSLLGYVYPAYMTYKAVEKRQPDVESFQFWCKYWILLAILYVVENMVFGLVTWLPFYSLFKLVFVVYLWHPRTLGALLLYHKFVVPMVARHEVEIDTRLAEVQARGMDLAMEYSRIAMAKLADLLQRGAATGQTLVRNQYQSFSKRAGNPYPPTDPSTTQYTDTAAGQPDSMGNLRARKAYEGQPY